MKLEMRAPRGSDIRDQVKTLKFGAENDDELAFLTHLSNVYHDGGLVLIYHSEDLVGKKRGAVIGNTEPSFAWNVGMKVGDG